MTDALRTFVEGTGPVGPLVFVLAYVVLTVAFVPGTIPSLVAGALFGPVWGVLLVLVGATGGAVAAFELARRLGRERLARRFGDRVAAADRWVGDRGLTGVLALRLVPAVPFNALNYAFGLSAVRRRDHLIGTAVGIVPGTVAFVVLGDSVGDPGSPAFLGSLAAVLLLIGASVVLGRHSDGDADAAPHPAEPGSTPAPPAEALDAADPATANDEPVDHAAVDSGHAEGR